MALPQLLERAKAIVQAVGDGGFVFLMEIDAGEHLGRFNRRGLHRADVLGAALGVGLCGDGSRHSGRHGLEELASRFAIRLLAHVVLASIPDGSMETLF